MDLLFMVISLQPTISKTGGKFIVLFPIHLTHIWSNREWGVTLFSAVKAQRIQLLTNRKWAAQHALWDSVPGSLTLMISHPMANSGWVTAQFIHTNLVMSHPVLQQAVSDTIVFLCQEVSLIMSHRMINSLWVTLHYFLARQSHQSCLIPWPTVCEWHCFIALPGSLINHVLSHDQQGVSDTTLLLFQAVSSHPMTNSMWVTLLYFLARQSHQSCLTSHDQQGVSDIALFHCQAVSSIMSHPMTNRKWVTLLYFFAKQSHQS